MAMEQVQLGLDDEPREQGSVSGYSAGGSVSGSQPALTNYRAQSANSLRSTGPVGTVGTAGTAGTGGGASAASAPAPMAVAY